MPHSQRGTPPPVAQLDHDDDTLHLPRILCLHGGGTNATIFRAQCRRLAAQLSKDFRFIFAEAPYDSKAGPDVLSVYSEWGPFKRWLRWRPEQPHARAEDVVRALDRSLQGALQEDDELGATGEVVALLGFSQGAKVAASLLYRQQVRMQALGKWFAGSNYRFGVLLAGRAPFVSLDLDPQVTGALHPPLPDASQITDVSGWEPARLLNNGHVLTIPTVHVHGMRDPGLDLHRQLFDEFCADDSKTLVEWDGEHRVPLKPKDVKVVAEKIRELARLTDVI